MRIALVLAGTLAMTLAGCGAPPEAERGRLLLRQYGCGTCHRIPGVATATGDVGPSLERVARRTYLAGTLPNTPANMARFIRAPQSVKPQTLMPDLRVGEAHAADMVAYLSRLR
jgi:cytochrome c551/c552